MLGRHFSGEISLVHGTEGDQGHVLLVEHTVDQRLDRFGAHAVDLPEHGVYGVEGAEAQLLAGQAVHPRGRRFEGEQEVAFQMVLGAAQLFGGDAVLLQRPHFADEGLEDLAEIGGVRARVEVEDTRVPVLLGARVDGVDQTLTLPHLLEEARGHAAPHEVIEQVERIALGSRLGNSGKAHDHLHLLERPGVHVDARLEGGRFHRGRGGSLAREGLEAAREAVHHLFVLYMARHGHHHASWRVFLLEVADNGRAIEPLHDLATPEDGPPQGMAGPHPRGKEIVDQIIRGVLDHLHLLEHHRLLALDVLRRETGPQQHVGQEIRGQLEVLVEHADVEARVFLGREGVQLAAHGIDGAGDVLGRAILGTFEHEMLDQVGDAAALHGLDAGARLHPDPDGDRADVGEGFGDHADATGQHRLPVRLRPVGRSHGVLARAGQGRGAWRARALATRIAPASRAGGGGCYLQLLLVGEGGLVAQRLFAREAHLAAGVDLDHLDQHLVTLGEHVAHRANAGLGDLGDVEQPLRALHDLDEGPELLDALHLAEVDAVQLRFAADVLDDVDGHLRLFAGGREHRHLAVVLHVDLGPRLLLDPAYDLAAGADDLPDLLRADSDGDESGRVLRQRRTRCLDGLGHLAQHVQSCLPGLGEGLAHDVHRDAADLDVHLERSDSLVRAGDLEVHVAVMILAAHDIGQDPDLVAFLDESHGDAGHGRLQGHPRIHERHGGPAHRGHG